MKSDERTCAPAFRIGTIAVDGRAVLAPLSGVTDAVFRRIARRHGAALVVSEMVASDELVRGSTEALLRAEGQGIFPHVVQLAGRDPSWMRDAVKAAEAAGAHIVDINMGCPAKRVVGGYAGAALMRDLDHACRLIAATVDAASIPVTVKMRLGWDHAELNAMELARRAQELGVKAVTVHGRTRQQFYKGRADWQAIARVSAAVAVPLIANGDVGSLADARRCLDTAQACAVMIGRAAVGQPWIVGRVARGLAGQPACDPAPAVMADIAVEHLEGLLSLYGRDVGVRHARKHLAAYADCAAVGGFFVGAEARRQLVTTESPRVATLLLREVFDRPLRDAA